MALVLAQLWMTRRRQREGEKGGEEEGEGGASWRCAGRRGGMGLWGGRAVLPGRGGAATSAGCRRRRCPRLRGEICIPTPLESPYEIFSGRYSHARLPWRRSLDVIVRARGLGDGSISLPLMASSGGGGSWSGVAHVQLTRGGAVAVMSIGASWWLIGDGAGNSEGNRRGSFLSVCGSSVLTSPPCADTSAGGEVSGDGLDLSSIAACTPRPSAPSYDDEAGASRSRQKFATVSVIRTYNDPHDGHVVYVCEVAVAVRGLKTSDRDVGAGSAGGLGSCWLLLHRAVLKIFLHRHRLDDAWMCCIFWWRLPWE